MAGAHAVKALKEKGTGRTSTVTSEPGSQVNKAVSAARVAQPRVPPEAHATSDGAHRGLHCLSPAPPPR